MKIVNVMIVVLSVSLVGCTKVQQFMGSDDGEVEMLTQKNIAGTWVGRFLMDNNATDPSLSFEFVQNGNSLTGTYEIEDDGVLLSSGTTIGALSNNDSEVDLTLTQTVPCAGTFSFAADQDGNNMPFSLNGNTGCYDVVNGRGNLSSRQGILWY